jgi:hypothetical protein
LPRFLLVTQILSGGLEIGALVDHSLALIASAIIRITNAIIKVAHIGAVTHHHDQSITWVSFKTMKTTNNNPGNVTFIIPRP